MSRAAEHLAFDNRERTVDELFAAAAELEWAERRMLAAIEGARRARVSWAAMREMLDYGDPRTLRKWVVAARRRQCWRNHA